MTGCNLWPLYNTTNWKNICGIFVIELCWPCNSGTVHSMKDTHTPNIKDTNSAEALRLVREFSTLSDSFYALEAALSATEFSHGNNEWAQAVIKTAYEQTEEMLAEMVRYYGIASGHDELNAKFQRGIVSSGDYYWALAFSLRAKFVNKY